MMQSSCFTMNDNILTVNYEPFNDLEHFSKLCIGLLNNLDSRIIVEFKPDVEMVHSHYIGSLMNLAFLAQLLGKKLVIHCSPSVERWFKVLGGEKLIDFIEPLGNMSHGDLDGDVDHV